MSTRAAALEQELAALQNSHRLAVHVAEDTLPGWETLADGKLFRFPHKTWKLLNTSFDKVTRSMQAENPVLLSMSLLGSADTQFPVRPYMVLDNVIPVPCMYAVDLSQSGQERAYIPRIHEYTLGSGERTNIFKLTALPRSAVPALAPQNTQTPHTLIANSMDASHIPTTEQRLDALGEHIRHVKSHEDQTQIFNELIVATPKSQLRAIMVPMAQDNRTDPPYRALVRLSGAIMGLQHLQQGIDLPVMTYHVKGNSKGAITYLGQGPKELRAVAVEALSALQSDPKCPDTPNHDRAGTQFLRSLAGHQRNLAVELVRALEETKGLGFNPFAPIATQLTATDRLAQQMRVLTAGQGR